MSSSVAAPPTLPTGRIGKGDPLFRDAVSCVHLVDAIVGDAEELLAECSAAFSPLKQMKCAADLWPLHPA
ncbi:MAG: hypothetical protein ACLPTZ_15910, partial [Beijerinckiaceae bacterium]